MKRFIQTIKNIWSIDDLRQKIVTTLVLVLIYRVGSYIIIPGVDSDALQAAHPSEGSGLVALIAGFTGGAFTRASIMALGVMPYISASIVMQLLGVAVPQIQKIQRDGESGRKKIQTYTKILTIVITILQAPSYLAAYVPENARPFGSGLWDFTIPAVAVMVAATMFLMWLGDRITDKGIGNGISLLIMIGIVARFPEAIAGEFQTKVGSEAATGRLFVFILELVIWFAIIAVTIMLIQGVRKIPLQYARQMAAGGGINSLNQAGARQYIPIKVNIAGVMPIIFAQAIMFIPQTLLTMDLVDKEGSVAMVLSELTDPRGFWYNFANAMMIILFTFFYTAMVINPRQWADDFKKQGAFVPGIKPGGDTANYIDTILSKITFPGSVFLAAIAVLPAFAMMFGVQTAYAYFFGGTSLLIMVGVVIDTLQQIESHLLMRHYDGLMQSGKIRGRAVTGATSSVGV
ncbi:MAG: preprotein translocase subunit SecY [Flavobacteriales bacterium]